MAVRRADRAERLLDLISFFLGTGARPVNWEELQAAFPDYAEGSSEARIRKFERDKAELLEIGVPLVWVPPTDEEPGGYLLAAEDYYLRDLRLDPDEATLLSVAGAAALQQPDFPFRTDLAHALDKLVYAGAGAVRPAAPVVHLPGDGAAAGVVEALGRAIASRKEIRIRYRSFRGEETVRTVEPWGLAWRRGAWFLVGHCRLRGGPRTFQAERIVELEVNAARPRQPDFDVPADFDVTAWVGRSPWQFAVHEPIEVELRLDPEVALLARARFGDDARIETLPGGGASVRLVARNAEAVVREALSLAPRAEVVAPAALRRRVAEVARGVVGAHEAEAGEVAPFDGDGMRSADGGDAGERAIRGLPSAGTAQLHERIRRALFLIPWVVRHPGCTVEELAAAARLSPEEVLAEIDFLRLVGRPPFSPAEMVDIDVVDGRVEVFLPQGLSRPPSLTPLEAAALDAAASAFEAEGGEALVRAREKLRSAIPPRARERFDELAGRVRLAPAGLDRQTARLVDDAIAQRREISFTYWTAARGEASRRRVRPLERILHRGYWYLHAFCCERRDLRLFRLDRAVDFALEPETFDPLPEARIGRDRLFDPGGRPVVLRLQPGPWASDETARRLGASAWRRREDGALELLLRSDGTRYPVATVLSFAGSAELLSPADLRAAVAAAARTAAERHA